MNDAQELQPFLDKILRICQFGIGTEENCVATMSGLPINAWIKCYVHSNSQEQINNLATAVQNGFISKQTASERCPEYPKTAEYERIMREKKDEQQQDLLIELQKQDNQTENAIEEERATAGIQGGKGNVRTGRGKGRPRAVDTDHWGNRKDGSEHNWDDWNNKH